MVGAPANGWLGSFQKGLDAMEDPEPTCNWRQSLLMDQMDRYGMENRSSARVQCPANYSTVPTETGPGGALGFVVSAFLRLGARATWSLSLGLSPQASISICCCVPGERNMNLSHYLGS